jgi:hypothetical protein
MGASSAPREAGAEPQSGAATREGARWVPELLAFYEKWRRSYRAVNRGSILAAPSAPLQRY